jgi:hypothetical protein
MTYSVYKIMKVIVAEILPCLLQTVTCSSLRLVRLFSCLSTPCIFVLRAGKINIYISAQTFFFPRVYNANNYIQNLRTSQGYIFLILQQFATKRCNVTNFKMLVPAMVMNFVLLVHIKISSIAGIIHLQTNPSFCRKYFFRGVSHPLLATALVEACKSRKKVHVEQGKCEENVRPRGGHVI